jgi:hypothetical protein
MKQWDEVSPYTGRDIEEDAPTTSAGSGAVHGIGVGPHGEPGFDPKKKKKKGIFNDVDAKTKGYKEHRKKLEAARLKRLEQKKVGKFVESILSTAGRWPNPEK